MIEFQGVCKSFASRRGAGGRAGEIRAVRDVSISVSAGEVLAVVGPNGAGKSTLFALSLGFLRPDEGTVRVNGAEPRAYLRNHGAAYLPERFQLPARWKVRAALTALARLEGFSGAQARERVGKEIQRFGLDSHAEAAVASLSRGLLQRLGLAQAALGERRLVILDEPTQGLDPLWRVRFRAFVKQLAREGRTVLIASHDLAEIERLSDRVVLLDDGAVRSVLEPEPAAPDRLEYRLELAEATAAVTEIFPGAELLASESSGEPRNRVIYRVTAANPAELSARLAALIEAGATVASVIPGGERLEERVRHALGGGE